VSKVNPILFAEGAVASVSSALKRLVIPRLDEARVTERISGKRNALRRAAAELRKQESEIREAASALEKEVAYLEGLGQVGKGKR